MNWLPWWPRHRPRLSDAQRARLARLAPPLPLKQQPLATQRWVVLDVETSGLHLQKDHLLSIGAVVIENAAIPLGQQFSVTLQHTASPLGPSVLLHGLAPSTLAAGQPPAQALLDFLEFLGDSPILAFHAGFDRHMLARALQDSLGYRLRHRFYDVADMAPLLYPEADIQHGGLDDWLHYFGLHIAQRHHASADALVSAEIALILLNRAQRQGLHSLEDLEQALHHRRLRRSAPSL